VPCLSLGRISATSVKDQVELETIVAGLLTAVGLAGLPFDQRKRQIQAADNGRCPMSSSS
jgi:hypothetical protein